MQRTSALQTAGLSVHIFYDDIVNFAERSAIFQNFPRFVGVEVDFYKRFVADRYKAIAFKVFGDIFAYCFFAEIFAFD